MVWKRRPMYHFRYQFLRQETGFDPGGKLLQSDLASRGLELATEWQTGSKTNRSLKKVETRVMARKAGITIQGDVITIKATNEYRNLLRLGLFFKWEKQTYKMAKFEISQDFSHRGFMLDTGRKFIHLWHPHDIMLNMAYYKMNDLQLHLCVLCLPQEHLAGKKFEFRRINSSMYLNTLRLVSVWRQILW